MRYQDHPYWQGKEIPRHLTLLELYIDKDFQLTRDDIDNGDCQDHENCPLTLALHRFLGKDFKEVKAFRYRAQIGIEEGTHQWCWYSYSKSLINWIADFDKGYRVKPITLRFTRPNGYQPRPILEIVND